VIKDKGKKDMMFRFCKELKGYLIIFICSVYSLPAIQAG
jgi:hypothetical protein